MMITALLAGRWVSRQGSRPLVAGGMGLTVLGATGLVLTPGAVVDPVMQASLVLLGAGSGFVQSATMTAVTFTLPADSAGTGLGVFNVLTFVGGSVGLALSGALLSLPGGFTGAFGFLVAIAVGGMVIARATVPANRMELAPK